MIHNVKLDVEEELLMVMKCLDCTFYMGKKIDIYLNAEGGGRKYWHTYSVKKLNSYLSMVPTDLNTYKLNHNDNQLSQNLGS